MGLRIRPADVQADRTQIVECLRRYLAPDAGDARFDWLYVANPSGPARVWLMTDDASGSTVGVASAFPRRARLEGKETLGWVLGDFCIHDEYRTLGPALKLNRACLEAVDHGSAAFCYDFPSRSMMAVYKRLRIVPIGDVVRHVRVLRWGRRLRRSMANPVLGAGVGALASLADRKPRGHKATSGLTVTAQTGACGTEFDALNQAMGASARLTLDRSASHLNWRYHARPGSAHEMIAARDERGLRGYATFHVDGDDGVIADLSARDDDAAQALLDETLARLWQRGAVTVAVSIFPSHPLAGLFTRSEFRPREGTPVILHGGPSFRSLAAFGERDLPLMHGDRES